MKRALHILCIACLFFNQATELFAQDVHFSQFFGSPLTLNPAETGNFEGTWRLSGIYRNQWRSFRDPINSIAAGYDHAFGVGKNQLGLGGVVISDNTNGLNVLKIYLSGGYHLNVGKSTLHFGLQLGYVNKRLGDDLSYPDQFNMETGYFDDGLTTADAGIRNQLGYFDLNGGVMWSANLGKFKPTIGVSVFHGTMPKESFTASDNRLKPRPVVNARAVWDFLPKLYLEPNLLYMRHSGATDFVAGFNLGYKLKKNNINLNSIYVGPYLREGFETTPNAVFIAGGARLKNLQLGAAYDLNVSELKNATNLRGAFEVYFIYTGLRTSLEVIQVPCERL